MALKKFVNEQMRDGDLVAEDTMEWGQLGDTFQQSTFGGHFVEVGVDRFTGVIRVRRMLAVCMVCLLWGGARIGWAQEEGWPPALSTTRRLRGLFGPIAAAPGR